MRKFWIPLGIIALILYLYAVYTGTSAYWAGKKIFSDSNGSSPYFSYGSPSPKQLSEEGDGRINILLLGIGGANHPGGLLTDTIMVASIDPVNKKVALLSIPRDLYTPIYGDAKNKINYAHAYGEQYKKNEGGGPVISKKTVSWLLDLPIHYYIRADFTGFTDLIDTLGGVDVYVEKAINDPYYPDAKMIGYEPFSISAGQHHLDGKTALKYARSRETTSDFDRARRQQQILQALKDKATSTGIVANPKKWNLIIQVLGNHLKTDLSLKETEQLIAMLKDIKSEDITAQVLDNTSSGLLTSSSGQAGYYLVPKDGTYQSIRIFTHTLLIDPYLQQEGAKISLVNATGKSDYEKKIALFLQSYGYNIVEQSSGKTEKTTTIYDYTGGKDPYTIEFLKNRFQAKVVPSNDKSKGVDIEIQIGQNYLKLIQDSEKMANTQN